MKRYVALLRGINVSGKNKIVMSELKTQCMNLGLENVVTYLNSGNVIFSSNLCESELQIVVEKMIQEKFGLCIPVFVIEIDAIKDGLAHAPSWWGNDNKEIYDNLIFVFSTTTAKEIYDKIGVPTKDLEQIEIYQNMIFWSFDLKKHAKANWWKKTASTGIGEFLTIRTANTIRKVVTL